MSATFACSNLLLRILKLLQVLKQEDEKIVLYDYCLCFCACGVLLVALALFMQVLYPYLTVSESVVIKT